MLSGTRRHCNEKIKCPLYEYYLQYIKAKKTTKRDLRRLGPSDEPVKATRDPPSYKGLMRDMLIGSRKDEAKITRRQHAP